MITSISVIVKEVLRTVSPIMEDVGIDEAYLNVTGIPDANEEITGRIKAGIKKKVRLVGVRASNFQGRNDDRCHPEVPDG